MKDVLVVVADDAYIDHAKALAAGAVRTGGWRGDLAAVSPRGSAAAAEFARRGWDVLEVEEAGFLQKFRLFDVHWRRWERALFFDCDVLVQGSLDQVVSLIDDGPLWMDTENGSTIDTLWRFKESPEYDAVVGRILEKFPAAARRTFNTSAIAWRPAAIFDGAVAALHAIQREFGVLNDPLAGGTDQQIVNFLLWDMGRQIPRKLSCYWGYDEPQNRTPNGVYPEWTGEEVPAVVHYTRWYAPWIKKTPEMDAYLSPRLGKPCLDVYRENLAAFDSIFPGGARG